MQHLKSKRILFIIVLLFCSFFFMASVMGLINQYDDIRLDLFTVSLQHTDLPSSDPDTRIDHIWRLFDSDRETAYTPAKATSVQLDLNDVSEVSAIRVFGSATYKLNVYRKNGDGWIAVDTLSNRNMDSYGLEWNALTADQPFLSKALLLEFIPKGNDLNGIREIQVWGRESTSVRDGQACLTLEGIDSPDELKARLAASPHIVEYGSTTPELTVPESGTDTEAPFVTIGVEHSPAKFKRAYILYEGKNILRPINVMRRINGLSWSGGFIVENIREDLSQWSFHEEEINPAWLVQGTNRIEFLSAAGEVRIRNVRLVVETDSGWNSVSSVSHPESYDGDVATPAMIDPASDEPYLEVDFDGIVEPEALMFHVSGSIDMKASFAYRVDDEWKELKSGWSFDMTNLRSGWNDIPLPALVKAEGLRISFTTKNTKQTYAEINEVRVGADRVVNESAGTKVVISYPRNGEFFGRMAYIQGFVVPAEKAEGVADVLVEGKPASGDVVDGSFSVSLSKDETRFHEQNDNELWEPEISVGYKKKGTHQIAQLDTASIPVGDNIYLAAASTKVLLDNNYYKNGNIDDALRRIQAYYEVTDDRDKHTEKVYPGQAKKITYQGVTLDIPAGAVNEETDITIIPLHVDELSELDPGMINVTYPAAGYRFLPDGLKFRKAIKISFGYASALFLKGQVDEDVNMYFYHEKARKWMMIKRVKVEKTISEIVAETDHFTDFINSTLVVPEHPEPLTYNPNSIKDIKAADPGAEINLIEPPQANNMGDARLSYPIQIPKGRNGMQPGIAVQYNSSGGNGWMGLGWDIPVQALSIDTRWGVPRYDNDMETETYLLDGEQLTPVAHRGELRSRSDNVVTVEGKEAKIFHSRVEGRFRKIVRFGTSPRNYWWKVFDKIGTQFIYGGTDDTVLADPDGEDIFKWALRKVKDTNGNTITYSYQRGSNAVLTGVASGGAQIYLHRITYTGHESPSSTSGDGDAGNYEITFVIAPGLTDGGDRRPDITINAMAGFKVVTADLLRRIDVRLKGGTEELIRSYVFNYEIGEFYKTRLRSITQNGSGGGTFYSHSFDYYNDIRQSGESAFNAFSSKYDWHTGNDMLSLEFLGDEDFGLASALGATTSLNYGGGVYIGFSLPPEKKISLGGKLSVGRSNSDGLISMLDINGDNLPDKVYKIGDAVYYRENRSGPDNDFTDISFGEEKRLSGISKFSRGKNQNLALGLQGFFAGATAIFDTSRSINEETVYWSDVNGDGLVDLVDKGLVKFNYREEDGGQRFDSDSTRTEVPIGFSAIDGTDMLPDQYLLEAEREMLYENPLMDNLRIWTAPYDGTVRIYGDVSIVDTGTEQEEKGYTTADGVRVSVQVNGNAPLWEQLIGPADHDRIYSPSGTDNIAVTKGDRIYFRVGSLYDGDYDDVSWDPTIEYTNKPLQFLDANNIQSYRFNASDDFTYAGRVTSVGMPYSGVVRIAGTLRKKGVTTDDIEFRVIKRQRDDDGSIRSEEVAVSKFISRDAVDQDTVLNESIAVNKDDELSFLFKVDSNIDLSRIDWLPLHQDVDDTSAQAMVSHIPENLFAYYESATYDASGTDASFPDQLPPDVFLPDGVVDDLNSNDIQPVDGTVDLRCRDENGNYLIEIPVIYDIEFYPDNDLRSHQIPWTAPRDGYIIVTPRVLFEGWTPPPDDPDNQGGGLFPGGSFGPAGDVNTEVVFTAKRRGELIFKEVIPVSGGVGDTPYEHTNVLKVKSGDKIFIDFTIRDLGLIDRLKSQNQFKRVVDSSDVAITYGTDDYWRIPLTEGFRLRSRVRLVVPVDDENQPMPVGPVLLIVRRDDEVLVREILQATGTSIFNPYDEYNYPLELNRGDRLYIDMIAKDLTDVSTLRSYEFAAIYGENNRYTSPVTGTLRIEPRLEFDFGAATPRGSFNYNLRKGNHNFGNQTITIMDGIVPDLSTYGTDVEASQGDVFSFRFKTSKPHLASYLTGYGADVAYDYSDDHADTWVSPYGGTISVSPRLDFDPAGEAPDGEMTFAALMDGAIINETLITVSAGEIVDPGSHGMSISVDPGDTLRFAFYTDDQPLASSVTGQRAVITYDGTGSDVGAAIRYIAHEPGVLTVEDLPGERKEEDRGVPFTVHRNARQNLLPRAYRGWSMVGYNDGNAEEEQNNRIYYSATVDHAALKQFIYSSRKEDYSHASSGTDPRNVNGLKVHEQPAWPAYAVPAEESWQCSDDRWAVTAGGMTSSRMGDNYIRIPVSADLSALPRDDSGEEVVFTGKMVSGVPKLSKSSQDSFGAGWMVSLTYSDSPTDNMLDFMDMNGDRFPDVVGKGRIHYTFPDGTRESQNRDMNNTAASFSTVRETDAQGLTLEAGGGVSDVTISEGGKNRHISPKPDSQDPKLGVSFTNLGGTFSEVQKDLVDINGDGLPDRVEQVANGINVKLNLGYRFEEVGNVWGTGSIHKGFDVGIPLALGIGYSDGVLGMAGGLSLTGSVGLTRGTLIDMNGDGLPDYVRLTNTDINLGELPSTNVNDVLNGILMVRLNTGSGFTDEFVFEGGLDGVKKLLNAHHNESLYGGAYYTYYIGPFCTIIGMCYIDINPRINTGINISNSMTALRDMNGDGYVDQVFSSADSSVDVALNRTGRTNLLRRVTRPLGASIEVDYKRSGNTYKQPQSRWVMSRVTVNDGHPGDGEDNLVTTFDYDDGYYDRAERDFYGYETVTTEQRDASGGEALYRDNVRTYHTDSFYKKGLLISDVTRDAGSRTYTEVSHSYETVLVDDGAATAGLEKYTATMFPRLIRTDNRFYEGQDAPGVTTHVAFRDYDRYGNVTEFFDAGDAGTDDDITVRMGYFEDTDAYIVGKADSITVSGNGTTLRRREGTIEPGTGNLREIRQYLADGGAAVTNLDYYPNGNLMSVRGPDNERSQRYTVSFEYDDVVETYTDRIEDSFGYVSTAVYDYKYGKPLLTTDINNNNIEYQYDQFGRTEKIWGPYDIGSGVPTIDFSYVHDLLPAQAVTKNKEYWEGAETIDTVLFVDGLKRVLQTKKEADVLTGTGKTHGMTVSGMIVYDGLGRMREQGQPVFESGYRTGFMYQDYPKNSTYFTYDVLDRTTQVTMPDDVYGSTDITTQYGFEEGRFLTTVTDQEGKVKKTLKGVRDTIAFVKEYLSDNKYDEEPGVSWITTEYRYNPLSEITRVIDNKGNTTVITYDNLGRRTSIDNPDTGLTEYAYDRAGNLTYKTTANLKEDGMSIHYVYDYNRLDTIDYPHMADVVYAYGDPGADFNRAGRIVNVENGDMREERFYGMLGETVKTVKSVRSDVPSRAWPEYTTQYVFDSFGRMRTLVYPDGEVLTYTYDGGGLLETATGVKGRHTYPYLRDLSYDEFGQRVRIEYGNDVVTNYDYFEKTRRLRNINTISGEDRTLQNVDYLYDRVGNITRVENSGFVLKGDFAKSVYQEYAYDDLHRLVEARGNYVVNEDNQNQYVNDFVYDTIGNFRIKDQINKIFHPDDGSFSPRPHTTYNLVYDYGTKPHAVIHAGRKTYSYDANGNMLGWIDDQTKQQRKITWDEENRVKMTEDQGRSTIYRYDDAGMRVLKRGKYGEIVYVNENFSIREGEVASKHVFAGNTRIVTKLVVKENKTGASKKTYAKLKDVHGHSGTEPEKSRGNHFGWDKEAKRGKAGQEKGNNGKHKGWDKKADPHGDKGKANSGKGQEKKAANTTKGNQGGNGQGQAKGNNENKGNIGKGQGKQGEHPSQGKKDKDYAFDTGLPGKSEKGLENALAHGNGHKYGIYKRLARRGLTVDEDGNIVPIDPDDPGDPGDGDGDGDGGNGGGNGETLPFEVGIYYYHGDHLGSSSIITDGKGRDYEHIEYFPYGETWIDEHRNRTNLPYKFTGKELDPETGLYYYGARYYDPVLSQWISVDPALEKYLNGEINDGVFNPKNLASYSYSYLNAVRFIDPDGNNPGPVYISGIIPRADARTGYAIVDNTVLGAANTVSNVLISASNLVMNAAGAVGSLFEPYEGYINTYAAAGTPPIKIGGAFFASAIKFGRLTKSRTLTNALRYFNKAKNSFTKYDNHHWWPKELGGANKKGVTVSVPSANPNLHTKTGGIHPEMRKFLKNQFGVDKWKQAKSEWFKLDFNTQKSILKEFYETQDMKMPDMKSPGIVE